MPGESALKNGIRVKLPDRQVVLEKPAIHRSARALGRCQLILITSGTHANSELSKALPHLMHEDSLVVTLQGGLGNDEFLAGIIPAVNLLGGLNFARIDSPEGGLIRVCLPGQFFLGEFMGSSRNRTLKLVQLFEKAGIDAHFSLSLRDIQWRALCWDIPVHGLTLLAGTRDTSVIVSSRNLTRLAWLLMYEIQAAANAHGVFIARDYLEGIFTGLRELGTYEPPCIADLHAGKTLDVESTWGLPLRRGSAKYIQMPHLETIYLLLKGNYSQSA